MQVVQLDSVADRIEAPPGAEPVAAQRSPGGPDPLGRLTALAAWWARVGPQTRPTPPGRVHHRWGGGTDVSPALHAEVTSAPFDPPDGIEEAFRWGVAAADDSADEGAGLLLVSVPAPEPAAVLGAHLLALDPVDALGMPARAGLDDESWIAAVVAIRDGLRSLRDLHGLPGVVLPALASPAIAAGTGLLLGSAARRTPVLLDGPGAAACALLAHRVTRHARGWWQAASTDGSLLHDRILADLALPPLLHLDLRREDGTAARLALALLEAATTPTRR